MTIDHDAIAAKVRCDLTLGLNMCAAYLDLYDEVQRLHGADVACVKCDARGEDCGEHVPTWADLAADWKARAEKAEAERDRVAAEWAKVSQRNYRRAKSAEAERADEWTRRREAEASRDLEKAVCATLKAERDALRAALGSIANNTCCDGCQEAALVARQALKGDDQ